MRTAIVSRRATAVAARLSADAAAAASPDASVHVLDLDGSYPAAGGEEVLGPTAVGLGLETLHRLAARGDDGRLLATARRALVMHLRPSPSDVVLDALPGVVLLRPPSALLDAAVREGSAAPAPDLPVPDDGLWPSAAEQAEALVTTWPLVARAEPVQSDAHEALPVVVPGPRTLLSAASLRREHRTDLVDGVLHVDGAPVDAIDLTAFDPGRPWLLDARAPREPRGRLSDHPAVADVVGRLNDALAGAAPRPGRAAWDAGTTALGVPFDPALRELYRSDEEGTAPDPYDPRSAPALRAWLTDLDGDVPRYLLGIRRSRPDLRAAFPEVPGTDAPAYLAWVRRHAIAEGFAPGLVEAAMAAVDSALVPSRPAPRRRRPPLPGPATGVAVVGYLDGDLGVGESARLMVSALRAVGEPHATLAVTPPLEQAAPVVLHDAGTQGRDTALICVNADATPAVVDAVRERLGSAYRIGMWYWEVEQFPPDQHGAFDYLDEVWVATDFVRRALAPHSPVPVVTVPPPLPQRGPPPALGRADLGLPPGPLFLFTFDFLSTAERKNPWGVVAAFRAAFAPGEGPTLVVKSMNAHRRPADAERLRLAAAGRADIVLREDRLEPAAKDALVATSDCYVSLHRSEGLGLTMAEAMAWGKPVVATAYGGNTEFMDARNSFPVPWSATPIPRHAEPYPEGGTWADPDIDAAVAALRFVVDHPQEAAAVGARAARDIAERHDPAAAGRVVAERLARIRHERGRRVVVVGSALRSTAGRLRRRLSGPAPG